MSFKNHLKNVFFFLLLFALSEIGIIALFSLITNLLGVGGCGSIELSGGCKSYSTYYELLFLLVIPAMIIAPFLILAFMEMKRKYDAR